MSKQYTATESMGNYYYDKQFKRYILHFMAIFSDMKVDISESENGSKLINVPIRYGHADRVVEGILMGNTQNTQLRLPLMSANIINLELDRDRIKGLNQSKTHVEAPYSGSLPSDLKTVNRLMPYPYLLTMELAIYASNTDQHLQIMEQILMLFDPTLSIQISDDVTNWNSFSDVTLDTIGIENNFPIDDGGRLINSVLTFSVRVNLSAPANIKRNVITSIKMRMKAIDTNETHTDVSWDDVNVDTLVDANNIKME